MPKKSLNVIIIDGPMGSGKTTVAKILHPQLKRTAHISLDKIKWFVSDFSRNKSDNALTAQVLIKMADEYLKNNISVLIDQNFVRSEYLEPFVKLAKLKKANVYVYQLTAPRALLLKRIAQRPAHPTAKPLATSRILKNLRTHDKHKYTKASIIDSASQTPDQIANFILDDIS